MPVAAYASLDALQAELVEMGNHTPEYWEKQVHVVAPSKTVDRTDFLVKLCTGKTILHIGCTGPLDTALRKVATKCYGIDNAKLDRPDFIQFNCDQSHDRTFPTFAGVEIAVCGELLEHLSNPGYFLQDLRATYARTPIAITVPNAFNAAGAEWLLKRGRENVHKDHVCYYSVTTLSTLLTRAGYRPTKHYWYGGKPYVSEGLIMLATPLQGPA